MRVVVTGATGVIGRRVVPILLGAGHRVTALVRPQSERGANVPSGCDVVVASLFEEAPLAKAIVGHEAVINLATHIPKSALGIMFRSAWRENDRIRTEGARNVASQGGG
ncbi:NAD(P)H-binding protein [Rhizobium laguerreae]|uniref:SDR family oxidoreductase n=1 Tax=Rhizobium laguerreae TaxID=1076926 RepID=UPI0014781ECB|nr:NAD(P)H-binding protein [Rhizobium laguerreae]NNH57910.1 NAD(P)H-binding protein [Rhizobium laguerreae]